MTLPERPGTPYVVVVNRTTNRGKVANIRGVLNGEARMADPVWPG